RQHRARPCRRTPRPRRRSQKGHPTMTTLVITLTAPWSWLVAGQLKKWETRSWATRYRGLIVIHTAKGLGPVGGKRGLLDLCRQPYFAQALETLRIADPL